MMHILKNLINNRKALIIVVVTFFGVTGVTFAAVDTLKKYIPDVASDSSTIGTSSELGGESSGGLTSSADNKTSAQNSVNQPATQTLSSPSTPSNPKTTTFSPSTSSSSPAPSNPTPPASPGNGCTPLTTGQGGYPLPNLVGYANDCNTGPRYACTTTQGTLVTSYHGQVIDRVCINGSLEIRHNNVTVRDVLVMGTGTYAIDIGQDTAVCPSNLRIEYTEVNMTNAADIDWGIYQRCAGGHVFDHIKVMYAGRGIMTYGNLTINQSYVYSNRTQPDAHRTAFSTHGGSNFTLTGNTLICVNTGCSSSLNIYSDYAPATNILIQDNVLAGGSICLRGGETHAYATQTHDIRVLNNRFSTIYAPQCGTLQAFAQFDESAPGNVRSGNVWHESGLPITGES